MNVRSLVASKLLESDAVDALTRIVTEMEHDLLVEAAHLEDATGADYLQTIPDKEDRREALEALIQQHLHGDLDEWTVEYVLESKLENAERAQSYLGMETGEWEAQVEKWADAYRGQSESGLPDMTDREVAERHVRDVWGVDLDTFETEVVEWSEQQALRRAIATPLLTVKQSIQESRAALEGDGSEG